MNGAMSGQGARIVALAEGWIGTPYRHQGATKGVGCDCIGSLCEGASCVAFGTVITCGG